MPINKRWSRFIRSNIERLPKGAGGVYELANKDRRIIDTGGSDVSVRARLMSHFTSNKYPTARYFRCEFADFLLDSGISREASHVQKFFQKHGRKPRYTKRSPRPFKLW